MINFKSGVTGHFGYDQNPHQFLWFAGSTYLLGLDTTKLYLLNSQSILWGTDGVGDIGALADQRPNNLYVKSGTDITSVNGHLILSGVGKGIKIKEGSNATMGVATLSGGTVVVSTNKVTANSRIQLTAQDLGTIVAPAALAVSARTAATSFTILSSDPTDTSDIAWIIVEPS